MVPPEQQHDAQDVLSATPPSPGAAAGERTAHPWRADGGSVIRAAGGLDGEHTLRRRAGELARVPRLETHGEHVAVLVFRLGDEQYAVELNLLRAVHRATGLVPVPCTPPYVAGVLNVRGEVISVLDLGAALGLTASPLAREEERVLLGDLPQGRVGLLVGEVLGQRSLALDELERPLSERDFVWGVAEARIVVLRLAQLFAGGRFEVLEDVT